MLKLKKDVQMGSIYEAKCKCGFTVNDLYLGAGMRDFRENCSIPFYCDNCEKVETGNILHQGKLHLHKTCSICKREMKPYGSVVQESERQEQDYSFSWSIEELGTYILPDTLQHCPQCKTAKLNFTCLGCFD